MDKKLSGDMTEINNIERMAVIGKLHSMKWLKSNSQVSGHTKTVEDGKSSDVQSSTVTNEINEAIAKALPTDLFSDNLESQENTDSATNLDTDKSSSFLKKNIEPALANVGLTQNIMETVWKKDVNVPNTLFPNAQSLVVNKLDEDKTSNMEVTESIVTAHLQQFCISDDERKQIQSSQNESDKDSWHTVCENYPDSTANDTSSQRNPKQCHDNNNNNAKSKTETEMRKGTPKTVSKVTTKKLCEQKPKKRIGNSVKELCPSAEPNSKEKNDSVTLNNNNNNNICESKTEKDKASLPITAKLIDKCSRVESYSNKHVFMARGARTKEQELLKQHGKNKTMEEPEDKAKSTVVVKAKSLKPEPEKRYNGSDDLKKCQRAQVMRTQSYNIQYSRTKPLVNPQQRYTRTISKSDQESVRRQHVPGSSATAPSTCGESRLKHTVPRVSSPRIISSRGNDNIDDTAKKCRNEPKPATKEGHDTQNNDNASSDKLVPKSSDASHEQGSIASINSALSKITVRCSTANEQPAVEKGSQGESEGGQRIRKDTNLFRRSADSSEPKYSNMKTAEHKTHNCLTDANTCPQTESTRVVAASTAKTATAGNKTNKTEIPSSNVKATVQTIKFTDTCSNNAKVLASATDKLTQKQNPSNIAKTPSVNDVRCGIKNVPEETINDSSNNRGSSSNVEMKSVKFSDNVQEINSNDHSYFNKPSHPNRLPVNSFLSGMQNTMQNTMEPQSVQGKNLFDSNTQYNATPTINSEQELQMMDAFQQKTGHAMHSSPQSMLPSGNPPIVMGNEMLSYQNMPTMYLGQYNNMHAARKTPDSTSTVQTTQIPGAVSFNTGNQTLLQNDGSGVLVHNNQSPVIPPGFRGHSVIQPEQWNLTMPEMFYYGNMSHPVNLSVQNTRPICGPSDFNAIQQLGYLQQPWYYLPPMCAQGWNPLLQYMAPLLQNPQYPTCGTFPNQAMPSSNLTDPVSCPVSESMQNNPYKNYSQMQQVDSNYGNMSGGMKYESYPGNVQGCMKQNNGKQKDSIDSQGKGMQYHRSGAPSEYQNCSQDQLMTPLSYRIALDAIPRGGGQSSMQMQTQQKYQGQRNNNIGYQRPSEVPCSYQGNQDYNSRRDYDLPRNETDCAPLMVSPRQCMYYGINYSKKPDNIPNTSRSEVKSVGYPHYNSSPYVVPQYQKNVGYQVQSKDIASRPGIGRGNRRTMEP